MSNKTDLPAQTDVVVVGTGAAALAAAVTAKLSGLDVLILEKEEHFGGTTAFSGGAMYLPLTQAARDAGFQDSREQVLQYLDLVVGDLAPKALRETFVDRAAEAKAFLEKHTEYRCDPRMMSPDYHRDVEGAVDGGRLFDVRQFNGRVLGPHLSRLKPPIETHVILGGMMVTKADVNVLLQVGKSFSATRYAAKLLIRHFWDKLVYGRGTRLVLGSALVGRLAKSAFDLGIPMALSTPAVALDKDPATGRVVAIVAKTKDGAQHRIEVRRGVVLGTGGFAGSKKLSAERRNEWVDRHFSMAPSGNKGDGLNLGVVAGGRLGDGKAGSHFWAPVSVWRAKNGKVRQFAHLTLDRAKPGIIAVNREGKRFTNEGDSYHRFGEALQKLKRHDPPAWLICDERALMAYGMGVARPAPAHRANRQLIEDGYLIKAGTIAALAERLGLPADALAQTIARHNSFAATGIDEDFRKGATQHNRAMGDPAIKPNPCLAPIEKGPFYAIAVYSGDLGTSRGLITDQNARVLDEAGKPIPGLFAVGNDMNSIMGGVYPGPGITLGPGVVFGYIAGKDLASATAEAGLRANATSRMEAQT